MEENVEIVSEEMHEELQSETVINRNKKIDKLLGFKDIKYRGIFSGRTMKVIGFVLMFFAQVYLCILLINKFSALPQQTLKLADILEILSYFALPMFLAANFCIIMTGKTKIKKTLITYAIIAIGIYLLVLFFFYRYMIGIANIINPDDPAAAYLFADTLTKKFFGKVINYNVFVDLALFSLFYFFLFYTPKKLAGKKSIIAFRLCCIIPIMLAVITTILYGLNIMGTIDLPVAVLAIMPCRSLTIYIIFFGIAFVIKLRQYLFTKWGGSQQEYDLYANTKRSSLEISVISSIIIFVVCLIDFLLLIINPMVIIYGLGVNFYLAFSIPLIMLLSYTRKTKASIWDIIMVAIFIFAVIILYLETGLYILAHI